MADAVDTAAKNGYLTKRRFLELTTGEHEIKGLGTIRFRKIGSSEYEALWPMPPAIADTWPKVQLPADADHPTEEEAEAWLKSRKERRQAEADWLRTLPDAEQVRWRSASNDVIFRTIAACCLAPMAFTVDEARALGDDAEDLYIAILVKSKLHKSPPSPATPPAAEAAAGAEAGAP